MLCVCTHALDAFQRGMTRRMWTKNTRARTEPQTENCAVIDEARAEPVRHDVARAALAPHTPVAAVAGAADRPTGDGAAACALSRVSAVSFLHLGVWRTTVSHAPDTPTLLAHLLSL